MSLTGMLRQKDSAISRFLDDRIPILALINAKSPNYPTTAKLFNIRIPRTILENCDSAAEASLIGSAMDFRARMYFRGFDVRKTLAADGVQGLNGAMFINNSTGQLYRTNLHHQLGLRFLQKFHSNWRSNFQRRRVLSDIEERQLCRDSYILACYERSYRGVPFIDLPIWKRTGFPNLKNLHSSVSKVDIDEVYELSSIFKDRAKFLYGREACLNPEFDGSSLVGGADADLICNRTIVEFKAVDVLPVWKLRETIKQLVGYFLLDFDDKFEIERLGAYFFRKAWYWEIPIWPLVLPLENVLEHARLGTVPDQESVNIATRSLRGDFVHALKNPTPLKPPPKPSRKVLPKPRPQKKQ